MNQRAKVICGALVVVILVLISWFSINAHFFAGFDKQKHEVQFVVRTFSSEKAEYAVYNNTSEVIGIWPDTCASETIRLQQKDQSESWKLYQPKMKICTLAPSVTKIKPGEIRSFTKSLKEFSLVPGIYRFELTLGNVTDEGQLVNVRMLYSAEHSLKFVQK